MNETELKALIRNSINQPVRICMDDGASYNVSHPDFALTMPDFLILARGPNHPLPAAFIVCPMSHISRVEVGRLTEQSAGGKEKYAE